LAGHYQMISTIKILNKNSDIVVSGGRDKSVRFWNLNGRRSLFTFLAHKDCITQIEITADDDLLVTCGNNEGLKIWQICYDTQKLPFKCMQQFNIPKPHSNGMQNMILSSNEKMIITAGNDNEIKFWNIENGELTKQISGGHKEVIYKMITLKNLKINKSNFQMYLKLGVVKNRNETINEALLTASIDGTYKIWDLQNLDCLFSIKSNHKYLPNNLPYGDLIYSENGVYDKKVSINYNILSVSNGDNSLTLWNF